MGARTHGCRRHGRIGHGCMVVKASNHAQVPLKEVTAWAHGHRCWSAGVHWAWLHELHVCVMSSAWVHGHASAPGMVCRGVHGCLGHSYEGTQPALFNHYLPAQALKECYRNAIRAYQAAYNPVYPLFIYTSAPIVSICTCKERENPKT